MNELCSPKLTNHQVCTKALHAGSFQPAVIRGAVHNAQNLGRKLRFPQQCRQDRFGEADAGEVLCRLLELRKAPVPKAGEAGQGWC